MIILAVILILLAFLITKYKRWIYILYKTLPRDLRAGYRFFTLNILLKRWFSNKMTVVKLFKTYVALHPHKVAFYFEDDVWTFKQIDEYSNRIGRYFLNAGYKPGDSVALLLENRPEYVCIWLGLAKIGVVTALINTNLTKDPLLHSLNAANSKALIFGTEHAEVVAVVKEKLQPFKLYQFHESSKVRTTLPEVCDLRLQIEAVEDTSLEEHYSKFISKDNLLYIYTSGTTGLPKAAVITNIRFIFMTVGLSHMVNIKPDDIVYNPLPLYHSAGGMVGVGQCLLRGLTVAMRKKFSATNYWRDCARYNCTVAQYIGEICRYLLAVPETEAVKHNVQVMIGNGLKLQIWNQFKKRFRIEKIYEFYGATEGNSSLVNTEGIPGAVGFIPRYASSVYPVTLIKSTMEGEPIRNTAGRCERCAPGEQGVFIGNINVKKPVCEFSGYADKKANEKKIICDVFNKGDIYFNSGDVLVQDEFGYFYFKDRTGDTFRWKGENVATTEVESQISSIVNLNDAVVYGVEIPNTDGRAGMAAIVDTDNILDIDQLSRGLKSSLPAYALPIFIRVMKAVPITGTFKLKKYELQEDGFDPAKINDTIHFYDAKQGRYVTLTKDLHADIISGKVRI